MLKTQKYKELNKLQRAHTHTHPCQSTSELNFLKPEIKAEPP